MLREGERECYLVCLEGIGMPGTISSEIEILPQSQLIGEFPKSESATMHGVGRRKMRNLVVLDELGRGSGGSVHRALHSSGTLVAVKKVHDWHEIRALRRLRGQFIVELLDAFDGCLEFMNAGSLQDFLRPVDFKLLTRVAFCVTSALKCIHSQRQLHRDIKPSNILLTYKGDVKVSDYGCLRSLDDALASTFTGTMTYLSPERISGQGYSYAADVWGLGMSVLAGVLGENPFSKLKVYWDHAIQNFEVPSLKGVPRDLASFITVSHQRSEEAPLLRHARPGPMPVLKRRSRGLGNMLAALHARRVPLGCIARQLTS